MAIKFSISEIKKAEINFYGTLYHSNFIFKNLLYLKKKFEVKKVNFLNFLIRRAKIFFNLYNKKKTATEPSFNHISSDLLNIKYNEFTKNRFCYIENFLNNDFYKVLLNDWPSKEFFFEADNPFKNYNFSFRYADNRANYKKYTDLKYLKYHPELNSMYNFLLHSNQITSLIYSITKLNDFKVWSIACSLAREGSFLTSHIDTVADDKSVPHMVNVIYFINGGKDPKYSGGTGIYKDNKFKEPIFVPNTMKNSALIYDSKCLFYHGFDIMNKDTYRYAMTFQLKRK